MNGEDIVQMVPCISIQQPWSWLIVQGYKDVECRGWYTDFRGRILVHAGKKPDLHCYNSLYGHFVRPSNPSIVLPSDYDTRVNAGANMGGIVGVVTITDVVRFHTSPWHIQGQWAFVLQDPMVLPFMPWRGDRGIFQVPLMEVIDWYHTHDNEREA